MTGKIRIISGQWRGRKLAVLDQPGLRPTSDRARETLFNWLGPQVPGARCLDLFAGTGALGLEAASRGAAAVTLVEKSPAIAAHISNQIIDWPSVDKVRVVTADVFEWLERPSEPMKLVFIDPPYGQGFQSRALLALVERDLLAKQALVYVEAAVGEDWAGEGMAGQNGEKSERIAHCFESLKQRQIGQIAMNLLRYREA